jgi:two-component system sensor histidine kinase KdpD
MREYREAQGIEQTWAITDQLLVAISPSPYSARLVRAARRIASSLHARWYAVYVEPRTGRPLPKAMAARLAQNLGLAEQLGAEVVTRSGDNPTEELLRFAREQHITKLIIGKPVQGRWLDYFRPSFVDQLVRQSGDIDVYVTAGDPDDSEVKPETRAPLQLPQWPILAAAAVMPALATGVAWVAFGRDQLPDVVMIYLLGIMLVSSRLGFAASIFAAFLSVAAFDFFFVPPYFTFAIADFRHGTTFTVMLVVAVVISGLTQRVRNQVTAAQERELRTAALFALTRELAAAQGLGQVMLAAAGQIEKAFRASVTVFTPDAHGTLTRHYASPSIGAPNERDVSVSQWVWANQREAGLGTTTLPGGTTLFLPLMASQGIVGVLGVAPEDPERLSQLAQRKQVDAFAAQMGLAMERAKLAQETEKARREIETEQLRSSLLSSVSHDLRTPLAVITGATGTVLQGGSTMTESTRQDLLKTVLEEAERLNRLIRNLLDMTRLESGAVKVRKEWVPLEEVVGGALTHLESRLGSREVRVDVPGEPLLIPCDAVLLEQVFINLVENAAKYSAGPIEIHASSAETEVAIDVSDRGPGIAAGEEERIFDKFHRTGQEGSREGVGLGLTICRAIVSAHGGKIWALNRHGGGATFRFTLPLEGTPPAAPPLEPVLPPKESN